MPKPVIRFFTEDINYVLKHKNIIKAWIKSAIEAEGFLLKELNIILCSDEFLLDINQQYLNHDTYTDVITFDNSEGFKTVLGDIFVSVDRIRENAALFNRTVINELCRVMIHGTLHLLGYKDKGNAAKTLMTEKEDHFLSLLLL